MDADTASRCWGNVFYKLCVRWKMVSIFRVAVDGWLSRSLCYLFLDSFFYFSGAGNSFEYISFVICIPSSVTVQRKRLSSFFFSVSVNETKLTGLRLAAGLMNHDHTQTQAEDSAHSAHGISILHSGNTERSTQKMPRRKKHNFLRTNDE